MKRLLLIIATGALLATPGVAAAAKPSKADKREAKAECRAERGTTDATREAFKAKYHSFGACVSEKAREAKAERKSAKTNAARECREERGDTEESREAFREKYGTNGNKKNAFGKCVSSTAKKTATEDAAQEKTAKSQAVEECRAVKTEGSKNAFGKCVSEKAKAKKAAADKEDEAQEDDRINAAKTCKAAKKADAGAFATKWGTKKNAYGKCVSATAKELAAERKAEEPAPTA